VVSATIFEKIPPNQPLNLDQRNNGGYAGDNILNLFDDWPDSGATR
jgi:hypothetical protein